jgi:hypothetical protein
VDSQPTFDQNGQPAVNFRFNPQGGAAFGKYTAENIGQPFAIVLDDEVISAPVIQSHIPGGTGIITGNFTPEESTRLAILLRAGALPAEITVLEQRTIGPELGQDSIEAGRLSALDGIGPENLNIASLLARVESGGIDEVVLAMNATLEGQTTAHYIAERLEAFPLRVTQLAHGLPVGGELDYLDEGTLAQALRARRPVG